MITNKELCEKKRSSLLLDDLLQSILFKKTAEKVQNIDDKNNKMNMIKQIVINRNGNEYCF